MPQTVNGYPYPAPIDTPDVPRDIMALATAVDALHVDNARIKWGSWVGTPGADKVAIISGIPTGWRIIMAIGGAPGTYNGQHVLNADGPPNSVYLPDWSAGGTRINWIAVPNFGA